MICVGAKTDEEVKEYGTCGSQFLKNKKIKKIKKNYLVSYDIGHRQMKGERNECERFILFYFNFLSLLSSIYGNRTIGIRRGKKQSALLDEGYAWEPKTRDFTEFSIKISKNPMFSFFSDLRLSDGQNWTDQEENLIHASQATRGYQNFRVSSNSMRYGFSSKYVNKYVYE